LGIEYGNGNGNGNGNGKSESRLMKDNKKNLEFNTDQSYRLPI